MKNGLLQLFLFLMLLAGCKKKGCFDEAGAEVTLPRSTAPFHQVDVYDNIDVVLTQDTIESIKITAPKHLEPNIVTRIENGILTLKNETACLGLRKASEKITVHLSVKKLEKIVYAGSGNIRSTNTLLADNIWFYSEDGAGNIEVTLDAVQTFSYIMDENADIVLHGTSDVCWSYTNARGTIDFSDFVVKKMIIEYGGVRDATIHVTDDLNSIIYFKGNLYYKGTPEVTRNQVHSSGRLIRLY